MISPELQNHRTRVRLRDNADPLDCLDLSRQSSSLLSPSVHPHFDGSDHENIFPFRVSPIESSGKSKLNTGRQAHLQSKVHDTSQETNTAIGPLLPLTNIEPKAAQASPSVANLPASEPLTPPPGPHPVQHEVRCNPLYASLKSSTVICVSHAPCCRCILFLNRHQVCCPANHISRLPGSTGLQIHGGRAQSSSKVLLLQQPRLACWKWKKSLRSMAAQS